MRRPVAREGFEAIHHPACFARRGLGFGGSPAEELRGLNGHTLDRQLRQRLEELYQTMAITINLDEAGGLALEDLARQSGEHAFGSYFYEYARTLVVHGANFVHELYRAHQVALEQLRNFPRLFRIAAAEGIGEDCGGGL